jgi:hypothetical protein
MTNRDPKLVELVNHLIAKVELVLRDSPEYKEGDVGRACDAIHTYIKSIRTPEATPVLYAVELEPGTPLCAMPNRTTEATAHMVVSAWQSSHPKARLVPLYTHPSPVQQEADGWIVEERWIVKGKPDEWEAMSGQPEYRHVILNIGDAWSRIKSLARTFNSADDDYKLEKRIRPVTFGAPITPNREEAGI